MVKLITDMQPKTYRNLIAYRRQNKLKIIKDLDLSWIIKTKCKYTEPSLNQT